MTLLVNVFAVHAPVLGICCLMLVMSFMFVCYFFVFPLVLHPASNQLVQGLNDGVRMPFHRPPRPPNIPSPPPLIPTTKPTDKPSFIHGGSISQVRLPGHDLKLFSALLLLLILMWTSLIPELFSRVLLK